MAPPTRSAWRAWGRNATLFVLTALSVFLTGALVAVQLPTGQSFLALNWSEGLKLMVALMAILLAHEMGHYIACRRYGVDATLPFFIPLPVISLVGTLGAFIRIRSRIPNRRALFDIGVAGPLAGFVVALPVLAFAALEAHLGPEPAPGTSLAFGEPLIFQWATRWALGPVPDGQTVFIGTLGSAAWFGLFLTALNLMPIGQLDGGHVVHALLPRHAFTVSRVAWWLCLALAYFGPNWLVWAAVTRFLGRRHPTTGDEHQPAGPTRVLVGLVAAAVFAVCFVPNPIVSSWSDILPEALRFWR